MAFSMFAFAGEGSDTIGACKMLPQLRYTYAENHYDSDSFWIKEFLFDGAENDWKVREHDFVVQLNWGVHDNVDLYAFVGGRIAHAEGTGDLGPGTEFKYTSDLGGNFIWGVGVKGTFYRSPGGFYFGGGLSFINAFTDDSRYYKFYVNDAFVTSYKGIFSYKSNVMHATADLHAGWNFKNIGLTPYVGVEYRWTKANIEAKANGAPFTYDSTMEEDQPFGVYVGVDYLLKDRIYFNLEGNMINRWGGSMSVGYLFDICAKPEPAPAPIAPAPVIEPKLEPMTKN
jgi:hypothetical protein